MSRFVYIVSPDRQVREQLRTLVEARGGTHVVPLASADAFAGSLDEREPGCVLIDDAPAGDDLPLIAHSTGGAALWPLVAVSGRASVEGAVRAMKLGALDYLEHPPAADRLFAALDLAQGRIERLSAATRGGDGAHRRFARLSTRERDVVAALLDGLSNKQVAHRLGIGLRTVEVHRANVMDKLEVTSVAALVRIALLADAGLR